MTDYTSDDFGFSFDEDEEAREVPPPLPVGATIGILGGGQLGRMLAVAAARLGFKTHIYEPGANPPAAQVANRVTTAPYDDEAALKAFGESVDVITYEFENIPIETLDLLEDYAPIRPNSEALRISQDRLMEKAFIEGCSLNIAPRAAVHNRLDLMVAIEMIGMPSILKTTRLGYDGKGQALIKSEDDVDAALEAMGGAPAVLEAFVEFEREISVIIARGTDGSVVSYDPGENVHKGGILATTTVPPALGENRQKAARLAAQTLLEVLDYVGVMGVEMFVTPSGLLVNEFAPRVHNSGHWTQNGCTIDQFEQHIRAICGWPLGDGSRHSNVVMENLIGDDMDRVPDLAADPGNALHLYGKDEVKPGRKMGHVNRITGPAAKA